MGPPLWNHYYADAKHAVHDANFIESIFADDLNAFQGFKTSISDDQIQEQLEECQRLLHLWGNANQITFDPAKESFHILHPRSNNTDKFKMLGITFDTQLKMEKCICEISAQRHSRISMILRCR